MTAVTAWRKTKAGVELRVRLTPKSSRDHVDGIEARADGDVIKARVRAVPEDGKANAALEQLIALWLNQPRRSVEVSSGGKSRTKTLTLAGDPAEIIAALEAALSTSQTS